MSQNESRHFLTSRHVSRLHSVINHLTMNSPSRNISDDSHSQSNNNYFQSHQFTNTTLSRPFRTLHTGIINDPDAVHLERKKPLRLELRKSFYENRNTFESVTESTNSTTPQTSTQSYPYTSILILDHVFHIAKLLQARHIHLKYVEQSGDTYIMFRTDQGLVPYSTIQNKHWIKYLLMHATGKEEYEKAGEGEFRLEVMTERDGRLDFTVNIVYIQGGVKLTLSFINV
ncbi:hypothetical protein FDP41_000491 [Naegleria fowleri]|uniref:Uncharacterized protein n=1 Tax=Naegleria fowleri TaxID=5763 RepID=A0A6A5CC04_NAEFO|nr:uncharacterized protein FDP41_000491 [Naegleria fowleri]KAF0984592.1 hypothetical protein FDP41_000491 [Naegleria fowleri]CAG4709776.1 unnamed protein product [Naegleria fowleri]